MATTHRTRTSMWWWLLLAVTIYTLVSICVGVATADACGRLNEEKTWQFFPPGWNCPPPRLPGQG